MILGSYYLTMQVDGEKGEGKVFKDFDEAVMAYKMGFRITCKNKGKDIKQLMEYRKAKIMKQQ